MNPAALKTRPIVAVDSDGSVLDAMTPKHEHAFTPALIDVWQIRQQSREAAKDFLQLNLFSEHRGVNRFDALCLFLRTWKDRPAAAAWPDLSVLFEWIASEGPHSEATLREAIAAHPQDRALTLALQWSQSVNRRCADLPPPEPFAGAVAALHESAKLARLFVVSGGNGQTIRHEWKAAGVNELAEDFLTQEAGSKTSILRSLVSKAGAPARVLMVGDSPLDEEAAAANGAAFFPIVPGREAASWRRFSEEALPAFVSGEWSDRAAHAWLFEFHSALSGTPKNKTSSALFPA